MWRRLVVLDERRADVREKVRIRPSIARSPCSQTVKNSPLSIKITLAGMLANIYTARRRHILKMMTTKELPDASPTRRSGRELRLVFVPARLPRRTRRRGRARSPVGARARAPAQRILI